MRRTLAAVAVAVLVPASASAARSKGCANANRRATASNAAAMRTAVLCLVNRQRTSRHLPPLHSSARLNHSAQGWTRHMVAVGVFSHGANFAGRISAAGYHWSVAGENIATGYATPAQVVRAWMASKGHCQNILNPQYRYVGTGVSDRSISGYSTLAGTWTQDFGLLMGQHAPSGNWGPAAGCPYTH
jgi:uncharacterized protein YkwD